MEDALEMTLLFDYYGELLTSRQQMCFDLRYNQDLSLGEIAQELNVSRQGVYDNLSRAETLLRNMEEKTGCVRRDIACRRAMRELAEEAKRLADFPDEQVSGSARRMLSIISKLQSLKSFGGKTMMVVLT